LFSTPSERISVIGTVFFSFLCGPWRQFAHQNRQMERKRTSVRVFSHPPLRTELSPFKIYCAPDRTNYLQGLGKTGRAWLRAWAHGGNRAVRNGCRLKKESPGKVKVYACHSTTIGSNKEPSFAKQFAGARRGRNGGRVTG
jgi:hypothetical protein